jgi:cytochrome P450
MTVKPSLEGLPPGPKSKLLNTLGFIREPYAFQRKLRARYGDITTVPAGNGTVVLGFTPEFAKAVFTAPPETFSPFATETLAAVIEPESLLVSEGTQHKRDRKLLTPPFHGARMRAYGDAMREIARARTARWQDGQVFRMHDETTAITLDVILRTIFGVEQGPAFDEGRAVLEEAIARFTPWILFTRALHKPFFPPWRAYLRSRDRVRAWLSQRIAEGRRRGPTEDLLGMLLEARYDDGSALTEQQLGVQLVTLLIAGHETTSIALAWAVHWLLRHPEALARVRAEVDPLGADADPEDIAKLPYLSAVCDESLRLYPILTEILRTLKKPLVVGDLEIPAGLGVGIGVAAIHEDPRIYPDPLAFKPERFLERKFGPFEFVTFGGGHRRCIGAAFAAYEMKLVLAEIVRTVELASAGPEEQPARRSLTMAPKHGVPVRVVGRRRSVASARSRAV